MSNEVRISCICGKHSIPQLKSGIQARYEELQAVIDHSFGEWNGADYTFDRHDELREALKKLEAKKKKKNTRKA